MAFPTTIAPIQPPPDDPFLYGWRYVRHADAEGGAQFDQIPLTLEDVLHPQEGDFIVHSEAHERRSLYLYDVFGARLADDPSAVVLHDVRVAWDIPGLKAHGPDLAVIFGVRERKNWSTFDVATEGVRPTVIVEITSPETAALDRSAKLEEYNLTRVPLYLIVDTLTYAGQPRLLILGYQQGPHGYRPIAADDNGRLWLDPLRLWIGVADNEIVCYDEAGQPLGDYRALAAETAALTAALTAETAARADAERRADEAEERLRTLEAELRRLRRES